MSDSRSEFPSSRGRASAPAGCSPRDSGRLLRSRAGSSWRPSLTTCAIFILSSEANAVLQQQLGEANTALRAKEVECGKLVTERDLLAAQLAEQKELLKKAQEEAKDKEAELQAEFEVERSSWTDKEAMLTSGFHEIEDIVDGKFSLLAADCGSGRLLLFLTCFFFRLWQTSSQAMRKPPFKPSRLTATRATRAAVCE